ncbi:FYVE, RhoGEF and PH domain-containing protein [Acrasis kona]|uniref:FYVE, RhoGEF and PH domain-containing protein n=1 Tax=Acrasis kona TaxID=1008807 RepID=A0AAW2Z0U8_9EUKA
MVVEDRVKVRDEIIETERSYLESLEILSTVYFKELQKKFNVSLGDVVGFVSALNIIIKLNSLLLNNFISSIKTDNIGEKFLTFIPFLKTYSDYFNKYDRISAAVRAAKIHNKKFQEYLLKIERNCYKTGQLSLLQYMIMPIQRVPRYNLLLKELLSKTPKDHKDYENIQKALDGTVSISTYLNNKMTEMEDIYKMEKIVNQLQFSSNAQRSDIIKPHRKFVHHGEVLVTETSVSLFPRGLYQCVVLSDAIMFCVPITHSFSESTDVTEKWKFEKLIDLDKQIPWLRHFREPERFSKEKLFQLNCSEGTIIFQCKDEATVRVWFDKVQQVLDKLLKKERIVDCERTNSKCSLQPQSVLLGATVSVQKIYRGLCVRRKLIKSKPIQNRSASVMSPKIEVTPPEVVRRSQSIMIEKPKPKEVQTFISQPQEVDLSNFSEQELETISSEAFVGASNLFKAKKYEESITKYTEAITHSQGYTDGDSMLCQIYVKSLTMRAQCYKALRKLIPSIKDYSTAIETGERHDINIQNCYLGRATANQIIKSYQEAVTDYNLLHYRISAEEHITYYTTFEKPFNTMRQH